MAVSNLRIKVFKETSPAW